MDLPIKLLKQIALYKFLTLSQLQVLNPKWSKKTLGKYIRLIRESGFIDTVKYGYHPLYGKMEDIHLLKNKGYKYLKERHNLDFPNTKVNQKTRVIFQDLAHRTATINCQIALGIKLHNSNIKILTYDNYFERKKHVTTNRYVTATRLELGNQYVIPDSILTTKNQTSKAIMCLEMHNGYRVSRIEKKCRMYARVLQDGAASKKYNIGVNAYVLNVFQNQSTLDACLERISKDSYFKYLKDYYLFKTHQNLLDNPIENRKNANQKDVSLISLSTGSSQ